MIPTESSMMLLIALGMMLLGNYFRIKLTGEIESLFAAIVTYIGLFLSIVFAPLIVKLLLFILLLIIKK